MWRVSCTARAVFGNTIDNESFGQFSHRNHAICAAIQHFDRILFEAPSRVGGEGSAPALRGSAARTDAPQTDRHAAEGPTADGRVEFCTEPYERVGRIFSLLEKEWMWRGGHKSAVKLTLALFDFCLGKLRNVRGWRTPWGQMFLHSPRFSSCHDGRERAILPRYSSRSRGALPSDLAWARTAGVFNRRTGHGPIQEVRGCASSFGSTKLLGS